MDVLYNYCDQRIKAGARARATGGFITPAPRFNWDMTVLASRAAPVELRKFADGAHAPASPASATPKEYSL